MKKRALNWKPDIPDKRDHIFKSRQSLRLLPMRKDLRRLCSPVEDQGALGSCTGNAIAGAIELLDAKKKRGLTDISRLFIYYEERKYIGEIHNDSGAYIRDGIKAIRHVGAAAERLWPYNVRRFRDRPSDAAYADAATRKFESYERIVTLNDMLRCLAAGYPFVFGFAVYSAFLSDKVARNGMLYMPKKGETMEGGHAVLAVGYSRWSRRFIVRNSWGDDWGRKGYFSMPFDYVADTSLADDMWAVMG